MADLTSSPFRRTLMMLRRLAFAALAFSMFAGNAALAKGQPCRDAKGKFTKCETMKKPAPCRDDKGKFTKCDKKAAPKAAMKSDMPMKHGMPDAKMPADN